MEDFVPPGEQPPTHWAKTSGPRHSDADADADADWRSIRAMRRWQDAVKAWGADHGMNRAALMQGGVWPTRPPPFRDDAS